MRRSTVLSLASLVPVAPLGAPGAVPPAGAIGASFAVLWSVAPLSAQEGQAAAPHSTPSAGGWPVWSRPLLLIGGLVALDRPLRRASRDLQGGVPEDMAAFGRWLGDWRASGPFLLAGTFAVAVAGEGGRGWRSGAAIALGVLAGSLVNEGVNVAVGRDRPNAGDGPWRFDPFSGHASFPSGHTALAFAFAGAADEATRGWAPAAAAYAAAALTGLSRVYDDKHWVTDVAAGALVGASTARLVTRLALGSPASDRGDVRSASGTADGAGADTPGPVRPGPRVDLVATPEFAGLRIVH